MTPPEEKSSFFDRGTILAILLTIGFFTVWNLWVEKTYPGARQKTSSPTSQPTSDKSVTASAEGAPAQPVMDGNANPQTSVPATGSANSAKAEATETFIEYEHANFRFEISSKGMGLRGIDVRSYSTRDEKPIVLGNVTTRYPFSTSLADSETPIDFIIERTDSNTFVGRASIDGASVEKTMKVDPSHYALDVSIRVTGSSPRLKGLTTFLSDSLGEGENGFLTPSFDVQNFTLVHDGSNSQHVLHKADGLTLAEKNVTLFSLGAHYFAMAIVDHSNVLPTFSSKIAPGAAVASGSLTHSRLNENSDFLVQYEGFAGPKSFQLLHEVDPQLTKIVNYGMFAWIAKPLLLLLRFLNEIFNNFGWSIVVLTILVRIVVLPFNVYSFRSMKAMQKIQPEMQRLRERFKDDPQTMNREVMDLMRRSKVNPLGGCLPMLLQLPVFIALYQVLGQSIELYKAPFMLWIQDLSAMDHLYVLPVLMAVTMFLQQKITPTTMPPEQQKIMQFLPLVFALMMVSLPSGLTLYIFVSTLFGVAQQYYFMREKNPDAKISQVRA